MQHRTVLVNRGRPEEHIFKYSDNAVYTTKYTVLTFIPKLLYEQFSRYANVFFLAIALMQQIPGVTPVNRYGTALPLSIIVLVTGVKEFVEDMRRRSADDRANNTKGEVFSTSAKKFERRVWKDICVGEIVKVRDGQEFPADLVLIMSSSEDGDCYVETSNIDGETNLKSRHRAAIDVDRESLGTFSGMIKCDEPNNRIYEYDGILVHGEHEVSLGPSQLLLRGSRLQNTSWVIGVVVYTGKETKIVMNSNVTRIKRSSIESMTNRQVLYLFVVLMCCVIVCFIAFIVVSKVYVHRCIYTDADYELQFGLAVKKFFTLIVLFHNLVPISLILTMEVIRVRLGDLIDNDMDLYCEESDTPAVAKTTALVEELGQVQYIFSDKTGTLTRNEMLMRQICVQGQLLDQLDPNVDRSRYPGLDHMLLVMAVCNTVVIKMTSTGVRTYQASSPDEVAIVDAAAKMNVVLIERKLQSILVKTADGDQVPFTILAVFDFDSARKRMSVVVRDDSNKIWIICKGADAVVRTRLAPGQNQEMLGASEKAISDMSNLGLRTLMFASREITAQEYTEWEPIWTKSQTTIAGRKESVERAIGMIENNLILAGISGVEDRLQEGVPETISMLHQAKIRLWVLTGDKMETAVNIGFSCKLLSPSTQMLQLSHADGIREAIQDFGTLIGNKDSQDPTDAAVVIEATALSSILEDESLQALFVDTSKRCRTVICCRVSPHQKSRVVELVQQREKAVCLSIGDGANDVGMIQAAHIEGLQAARSADFSIAQFRFLQKLVLVHGSWGYHRISKAALFCVYKNILLFACQFWYAALTLFSGQTVFESWMVALYNVVFTCFPPIVLGLTEQFVTADSLIAYPALYRFGQQNAFSAINGFWQSFLAFTVTVIIFTRGLVLTHGHPVTLFFMGTTIYAGIILTGSLKAALLINARSPGLSRFVGTIRIVVRLGVPAIGLSAAAYRLVRNVAAAIVLGNILVHRPTDSPRLFAPRPCLEINRFEGTITANRFEELSKLRTEKRAAWEAAQSLRPTEFVGTCADMCPEYERHEREAHFDVSPFEVVPPRQSVEYVAGEEHDLHKFIRDRTRSLRQDIIVQQRAIHNDPGALVTVVRLHEEIARFHILSGHRLCGLDFSEFDPFQNTEQLRKVLQSLQEYYTDIRKSGSGQEALQNEAEFRAYQILTHAEDQDVFRQALSFPSEIFSSVQVQFVLGCVSAFHQVDYVKYFQMVQRAEYLQACLLHTHFMKLRKAALRVIMRAYTSKEPLPGGKVAEWLFVEESEEMGPLVEDANGSWTSDTMGMPIMRLAPQVTEETEEVQLKARRSESIERKVAGLPMAAIIRAHTVDTIAPVKPTLTRLPQIPPTLPKPVQNEAKKNQIVSLMADNLIDWIKHTEVPTISAESIFRERDRRKWIKKKTVDRVTRVCIDAILNELCLEMSTIAIRDCRRSKEQTAFREQAVNCLARRISDKVLAEVVRKECHSIAVAAKPLLPAALPKVLTSGFSTPMKKSRSTPIPGPFQLELIDTVVLQKESMTARVEELKRTTLQERLDSMKLDELLKRAINS
ncbi:Phospholipid-transporting ATPase [Paramicrosporidium saccamoebae]|uniref:Phospholipid-transporting ATPase n=1 Tax=Paramicrosporidium saccamoebae TaxID=1246581 RepID=A0A2H9TLH7_9FUNG|nr:Phospholipid-transporting ATPase [Paramicrosporidium saccamoebae]